MQLLRRQMLASAGAFAAFAASGRIGSGGLAMAETRNWPLWSILRYQSDFIALGKRCLTALPELQPLSMDRLHHELAQRLGVFPDCPICDVSKALPQGVAREFAEDNAREVDGWYLSMIEILLGVIAFRSFAAPLDQD
jgi:hypothetical protein